MAGRVEACAVGGEFGIDRAPTLVGVALGRVDRVQQHTGSLEVGEEAGRYVTLGDDVLEFEISPNRPDNMSVYGIARELHAVTGSPLAPDPGAEDAPAEGAGRASQLVHSGR